MLKLTPAAYFADEAKYIMVLVNQDNTDTFLPTTRKSRLALFCVFMGRPFWYASFVLTGNFAVFQEPIAPLTLLAGFS